MNILFTSDDFDKYLDNFLNELDLSNQHSKDYIKGVFKSQINNTKMFEEPVCYSFIKGYSSYNFEKMQNTADFILIYNSIFRKNAERFGSKEYYNDIGKMCYQRCYVMLNKKWPLFKDLSDNFDNIIDFIIEKNEAV